VTCSVVAVDRLTKRFNGVAALDDVSFGIDRGAFVGLLGPNGAGKTTTLHLLLGLITATSGTVTLFGESPDRDRESILQRCNFASPYSKLPGRLTAFENLLVFSQIYGVTSCRERIASLLEMFGIAHLRDRPASRFSSGEATRLSLCKAFLNEPELLLLDEPTANLDPEGALQVRAILTDLHRRLGTTILYSSHNMLEVEAMCDRLVVLSAGRIVATGTAIEVTRDILQEQRHEPALDEVLVRIVREVPR
jgi:ABC-2 type transport system ATP-binding protein